MFSSVDEQVAIVTDTIIENYRVYYHTFKWICREGIFDLNSYFEAQRSGVK